MAPERVSVPPPFFVMPSVPDPSGPLTIVPLKVRLFASPKVKTALGIPLFRMLPEGEVIFDTRSGYLRSARTVIEKELTGHQGEGSSYRFKSTYTEEYVSLP